ncbi:hypothetical protein BST61_g8713 [Cercospora zeina]
MGRYSECLKLGLPIRDLWMTGAWEASQSGVIPRVLQVKTQVADPQSTALPLMYLGYLGLEMHSRLESS